MIHPSAKNIEKLLRLWKKFIINGTKNEEAPGRLLFTESFKHKWTATIFADTKFRKQQALSGPFTSVKEIDLFMDSCLESKEKNVRMYHEESFHRMTRNWKKDEFSFVWKKGGKRSIMLIIWSYLTMVHM